MNFFAVEAETGDSELHRFSVLAGATSGFKSHHTIAKPANAESGVVRCKKGQHAVHRVGLIPATTATSTTVVALACQNSISLERGDEVSCSKRLESQVFPFKLILCNRSSRSQHRVSARTRESCVSGHADPQREKPSRSLPRSTPFGDVSIAARRL